MRRPRPRTLALLGLAAAAAVPVATACAGAAAGPSKASASTLYVAPTGNDAGRCSSATSPCLTLDRAYHVARPGDTVELAAGSYTEQGISPDPTKDSATADVTFQPAKGATVSFPGNLIVKGAHVVLRSAPGALNFKVNVVWAQAPAHHVRFERLDGASFQIFGSSNVTILGGDWGPMSEPGGMESRISPDGGVLNSNPHDILLDGLKIHDVTSQDLNTYHVGGLLFVSGYNIAIRNTTFERVAVYDMEIQDFTSVACCGMKYGNAHDVTIENNRFGAPVLAPPLGTADQNDGQPEVQFDPQNGPWTNWTIRHNSFVNGVAPAFDGEATAYTNFVVTGNIGGGLTDCGGAKTGATWSANIWSKGPCSDQDHAVPFGYSLADARLVPNAKEAAAVKLAFAQAAKKRPPATVASALKRAGAGSWSPARLRALLASKIYLGGAYGPPGAHPALVTRAQWTAAQKR
jgi:hypothetical protein